MKLLFVHPGSLVFTNAPLRFEPLGLELLAAVARRAKHAVRIIDLQVESHVNYHRLIAEWAPDFVGLSCNYLANVPEIVDLAKVTKLALPRSFICVGGHSASFTATAILEHGAGAIDCVLKGEAEAGIIKLLDAVAGDRCAIAKVPGVVTIDGEGPQPSFVAHPDEVRPARDLVRHRHKYYIAGTDPIASIEFSRGCPWDCAFCSAWTFYGRSYRTFSPESVVEDMASIREPNIGIIDDVAFIQEKHGFAIGEAVARKGIRKKFYLETRADVLLRNKEVFQFWKKLGLTYIVIGIEAIDEEGLKKYRKRVLLGRNFEALEFARSLGINIVINIIADPDWDEERFRILRDWGMEVPEFVNIFVNTPYPGTESWLTEQREFKTHDYRLFDTRHAVLRTKLPLATFYRELLTTQWVLLRKHIPMKFIVPVARNLLRGQTNLLRYLVNHRKNIYSVENNVQRMFADHSRPVRYELPSPSLTNGPGRRAAQLYIHTPRGRAGRNIDDSTERFVDKTRIGTAD